MTQPKKVELKTKHSWVYEAKEGLRDVKQDAWRCQAAVDGNILTEKDIAELVNAGINPVDINRIFPVIGLLSGSQQINARDTIAKGRTSKDAETQQVMTEGIKYVMDQNHGEYLIANEFMNQIKGGIGYLSVEDNSDPRQETIKMKAMSWQNIWYDPFAPDPWLNPENCRYVFYNPWMDLEELVNKFPDKKDDIEGQYNAFRSSVQQDQHALFDDEGDAVERAKMDAKKWCNFDRQRVRPVELWYTKFEKALFAVYPDGSYTEITDDMPWQNQKAAIDQAQTLYPANVRRMWVSIFFGEIELMDERSRLPHDNFKFVPFVGYMDRFGFSYGVPRHLIGLNIEVIRRRSMTLELLKSRRVLVEQDAAPPDDPNGLEAIHEESQKMDGFMVLAKGALSNNKIRIEEQANLISGQMSLLQESENEIKEISGVNDEAQGWQGNAQSGKAMDIKIQRSATTTAMLFTNLSRSQKIMGEYITAMIQGRWTGPKVLRITDRLSGTEKFIQLNEPKQTPEGAIVVRNDVTQGRFDVIISEAPQTDTVRERNLTLISEWMDKADDSIKPILLNIAMEISDLPNKEMILAKLQPILGVKPGDEDLTSEQIKEQQMQDMQAAAEKQQKDQETQDQITAIQLETQKAALEKMLAEVELIKINIEKAASDINTRMEETKIKRETADAVNFEKGVNVGQRLQGGGNATAQIPDQRV